MLKVGGISKAPVLIIHGGVLLRAQEEFGSAKECNAEVERVARKAFDLLRGGAPAMDAVLSAIEMLERFPLFNAGLGAELQMDGVARLSASLMDGSRERFSGVALATDLVHPSKLVKALQDRDDRVLGPAGARLLRAELRIPDENPVTDARLKKWEERRRDGNTGKFGTVGAVAIDGLNNIVACTSTGGKGFETVERMGDAATVAGNFASRFAGISCTGIGEDIIDSAVAARLETRVRDGRTLLEASELTLKEAADRLIGWIAIDRLGHWAACSTKTPLIGAVISTSNPEPKLFYIGVE
ncbi:MAG: isoaspartyl peptidase/L-asparaginase [Deltaproteobacteria bacterium]|nr:isoaspartyl peptidase/L-asparaginase [Deltaproteobacteria bacterium]